MVTVGVVILLGPPGSGKGTQAKILAQKNPTWKHISTGDLFRAEIASQSELGLSVKGLIAAGQLVSDETTDRVFQSQVKKILNQNPMVSALLLDGYPRTGPQTKSLTEFSDVKNGLSSPIAVEMRVSEEVLVERLSGRLINPRSGKIYHKVMNPPKKSGICDDDGQPLEQRADDKADVIRSRYQLYVAQRDGILDVLKKDGVPVIKVDAVGEPSTITTRLEEAISKAFIGSR